MPTTTNTRRKTISSHTGTPERTPLLALSSAGNIRSVVGVDCVVGVIGVVGVVSVFEVPDVSAMVGEKLCVDIAVGEVVDVDVDVDVDVAVDVAVDAGVDVDTETNAVSVTRVAFLLPDRFT